MYRESCILPLIIQQTMLYQTMHSPHIYIKFTLKKLCTAGWYNRLTAHEGPDAVAKTKLQQRKKKIKKTRRDCFMSLSSRFAISKGHKRINYVYVGRCRHGWGCRVDRNKFIFTMRIQVFSVKQLIRLR